MGRPGVMRHTVGDDDFIADKYRLLKAIVFLSSIFALLNQIIIDIYAGADGVFAGKPRSYGLVSCACFATDANP
jgi:hypothetical protein